jgi:ribonuclease HI
VALIINVDGGSRGNPGPAGAGVVIRSEADERIHEGGYFLDIQTNNAAEYLALIRALQRAARCEPQPIMIRSDSELLVRQMTGSYRVKNEKLADLFHEAQLLLLKVSAWQFRHVPREENQRADELANLAMDQRRDVVVFDVESNPLGGASAHSKPRRGTASSSPPPPGPMRCADDRPVRVALAKPPEPDFCPAGDWFSAPRVVTSLLTDATCVHAAHAIVPTILAIQNTEPAEFSAVPTLTVRCTRNGCGAAFHICPQRPTNGARKSPAG